ncbi:MAG: YqcC family protein [Gammaproteobacteria bacterium]|nr:MAG: YqcC family protein [Gammaproteobacteria bacterium]
MSEKHRQLAVYLAGLEQQLRCMMLWSEQSPSVEALSSREPFAVDTLAFEEWLQFVFLPRLHQLVDDRADLPENCAVTPMAEEYFRHGGEESQALIELLSAIDLLLSTSSKR